MRIDLQPEDFCLMSHTGTERLEILNAQPALYPLERGDVQAYNIAQGQSSFQKNDLFLGKVPRRGVVGLV